MIRTKAGWAIELFVLLGLVCACGRWKLNPYNLSTQIVPLSFGGPISFADFTYDPGLRRVIIPAGETGQVALIDPLDLQAQLISGFSRQLDPGSPIRGATSAASAGGFLFGLDQHALAIKTIRLSGGNLIASTPVRATPDLIRFVSAPHELWVTEKGAHQIEIFSLSEDDPPLLRSTGTISIPNGPEALTLDDRRGLAFTNRPAQGLTEVIQVMTHTVIAHWGSGCSSAMGMAVDEADGYLLVACAEGKLVVMDINNDGFQLASQNYGGDLRDVAYNPKLQHVYLPSGASAVVAIFQLQKLPVSSEPAQAAEEHPAAIPGATAVMESAPLLTLLGTADTKSHAKCVTADEYDNLWVCDPAQGQVLFIHDEFQNVGLNP